MSAGILTRGASGAFARRSGRAQSRPVDRPADRRVAVLMGGPSRERSISIQSGKAVLKALREHGYDALPVLIDSDGDDALAALPSDVQRVFIALHGRFGEDGGVQSQLEERGIAYTGAGPEASALAFDKILAKQVLAAAGVPVPRSQHLRYPWRPSEVKHALRQIGDETLVVKPSREGSSIGVIIARGRDEVQRAIERSRRFKDDILIEEFIPGREMTAPIIEGLDLPLIEMETGRDFFDYQAKYHDQQTAYTVAPPLPPDTQARLLTVARKAHDVLGCQPFSRVDIRVDPQGRPWVLEVNTIPGMTATSLLPKAATRIGIAFPELCALLLEQAAPRGANAFPASWGARP